MGSRPGISCQSIIGRPSGDRSGAERVQCNRLSAVVIKNTPSPYQPTRMYALSAIRPICTGSRLEVGWLRPDLPPIASEANRGIVSANVRRALERDLVQNLDGFVYKNSNRACSSLTPLTQTDRSKDLDGRM